MTRRSAVWLVSQDFSLPKEGLAESDDLPLVVLNHHLLFPAHTLPVADEADLAGSLTQQAIHAKGGRVLVALAGDKESPFVLDAVATIGVLAGRLLLEGGRQGIVLQGEQRVVIREIYRRGRTWRAVVSPAPVGRQPSRTRFLAARHRILVLAQRLEQQGLDALVDVSPRLAIQEMARPLCDAIVPYLTLSFEEKRAYHSTLSPLAALNLTQSYLEREERLLLMARSIDAQAKHEIDDEHRRQYLREQLSIIKRELGEGDEGESEQEELIDEINTLDLPPAVQRVVHDEVERFAAQAPGSAEYMVSHAYLCLVRDLPWASQALRPPRLAKAASVLDSAHFGLEAVKERILEYVALLQHAGEVPGYILLLNGPPGVGKTSLAQSIAQALGRPMVRIALGGVKDESEIRGHRRTYIGALPGKILQAMKQAGSRYPLILLDELDKIGGEREAGIAAALLEVLDPAQNQHFTDHYLGLPFDLSKVVFVATANDAERLSEPLRDRMEIIDIPSYTEQEKLVIAQRFILPAVRREMKLGRQFQVSKRALAAIIKDYTREPGVRQLAQELRRLGRKAVKQLVTKKAAVSINPSTLSKWLGPPRYQSEPSSRDMPPGVAIGLAYTEAGGDILFIESSRTQAADGRGSLLLTGSLGNVMKESAQAVLSFLSAHGPSLGLDPQDIQASHFHIHFPDGATPKDGPSAGIAIMCAIASLLLQKTLPNNLAMTGEITLRGQVLAVGGIREKVLAAYRYGKTRVLVPEANVQDLKQVPADVSRRMTIIPVRSMIEVLRIAGLIGEALQRERSFALVAPVARQLARPSGLGSRPLPGLGPSDL